ncbi:MAG: 6-bladed beta-propeller [Bacteroidales bacterium]
MKRLFYTLVLLGLLFITSCTDHAPKEVITYDLLNGNIPETELKFSDLVTDIKIIPLEIKDSILIADSEYAIDDKYIVVAGKESIHQFDVSTGKHIRRLAVRGNGPNEYNYLNSLFIKNGKLFISSSGKNSVCVIDLETGTFFAPLVASSKNDITIKGMTNEEDIYMSNDSLLFELFNFQTQKSVPLVNHPYRVKNNRNGFTISGFYIGGDALVECNDEMFFYNANFSDTLYFSERINKSIGERVVQPYAVFKLPESKTNNALDGLMNSDEVKMGIPYVDSHFILCGFSSLGVKFSSASSVSMVIEPLGLYCINRENGEAKQICKYIFDPLFIKEFSNKRKNGNEDSGVMDAIYGSSHNWFANHKIYAKVYSSFQVKEYIKESLESPDFPQNKVEQLKALDCKITEEGNPIVFIGTKK